MSGGGEYEPKDSRNVTGTATTPDGRWTNKEARPPRAAGFEEEPDEEDEDLDDLGDEIHFEPDPELEAKILRGAGGLRH